MSDIQTSSGPHSVGDKETLECEEMDGIIKRPALIDELFNAGGLVNIWDFSNTRTNPEMILEIQSDPNTLCCVGARGVQLILSKSAKSKLIIVS